MFKIVNIVALISLFVACGTEPEEESRRGESFEPYTKSLGSVDPYSIEESTTNHSSNSDVNLEINGVTFSIAAGSFESEYIFLVSKKEIPERFVGPLEERLNPRLVAEAAFSLEVQAFDAESLLPVFPSKPISYSIALDNDIGGAEVYGFFKSSGVQSLSIIKAEEDGTAVTFSTSYIGYIIAFDKGLE